MSNCDWLPNLEYFEDYHNDWKTYEAAIYKIFRDDLINKRLLYKNMRVFVRRYPIIDGREEAFGM